MDVFEAIRERRTVKDYGTRRVSREEIERVLDAAVYAPRHGPSEPWGFYVLGEQARRGYGRIRARVKVMGADPEKVEEKRAEIVAQAEAVPALIAISCYIDVDPVRRDEDYAATFMAIQNLMLAATALRLGTHLRTGRILEDDEFRAVLGVPRDHRIVAMVELGEPKDRPEPRRRTPASKKTHWLP